MQLQWNVSWSFIFMYKLLLKGAITSTFWLTLLFCAIHINYWSSMKSYQCLTGRKETQQHDWASAVSAPQVQKMAREQRLQGNSLTLSIASVDAKKFVFWLEIKETTQRRPEAEAWRKFSNIFRHLVCYCRLKVCQVYYAQIIYA